MREIREEHDVKSSKQSEGVVLNIDEGPAVEREEFANRVDGPA
jgi:hypothetical protein